ncbi:hypothetical protein [Sulfuracidifex metallicus]|uniref:hypothetical protein n=1 Tax=Sulfuracidifex metallicus TaxID=47303 RepID=UPI000AE3181D|nr:hypothetical protein [Sulfuracidifex metallicus]
MISLVGEIQGDEEKLRKANVEVPVSIAKLVSKSKKLWFTLLECWDMLVIT